MLFKTKYDLIFGIGAACSCTQILRKCRLQFFSYPFDWLYGADIETRCKILANNFSDFINFDDLENTLKTNNDDKNLCDVYHNKLNNIYFNHDFSHNVPLQECYANINEKYNRRAKRLIHQIEKSKNVLVVYLQTPNNQTVISDTTLQNAYQTILNRFPNQNINLLYLYCNHSETQAKIVKVDNGIIKIELDYDDYNEKFPYSVNTKVLMKIFCKLKISHRFIIFKNQIKRLVFMVKCFFRGML